MKSVKVFLPSPSGEGLACPPKPWRRRGVRRRAWPLYILGFVFLTLNTRAQLPSVVSGKLERVDSLESKYVSSRFIDVWLPEGYNGKKKYAVLYMHDGQMLYDSATTWNRQEWGVDNTVSRLLREKKIRDVIVVGVWNITARYQEYMPQRPYESMSQAERDTVYAKSIKGGPDMEYLVRFFKEGPNSDNYLKFLVQEVKPYIDSHYATRPNRANTFVAGSSMGGLISMYAICEYPEVFGGAACMSTHWPGLFNSDNPLPAAFLTYLKTRLPDPATHKLYFDCGDATLDALYPPLQKEVDKLMELKGWTAKNWLTKYFPGDDHTERSWRKRFDVPVVFLLGR